MRIFVSMLRVYFISTSSCKYIFLRRIGSCCCPRSTSTYNQIMVFIFASIKYIPVKISLFKSLLCVGMVGANYSCTGTPCIANMLVKLAALPLQLQVIVWALGKQHISLTARALSMVCVVRIPEHPLSPIGAAIRIRRQRPVAWGISFVAVAY